MISHKKVAKISCEEVDACRGRFESESRIAVEALTFNGKPDVVLKIPRYQFRKTQAHDQTRPHPAKRSSCALKSEPKNMTRLRSHDHTVCCNPPIAHGNETLQLHTAM